MIVVNIIAFILVLIGCINWGLIGIFNWNLVSAIFGAGMTFWSSLIYILVFVAALWLIFACIMGSGIIDFRAGKNKNRE